MSTTVRRFLLPLALLVVGLPIGIGVVMAMGHKDPPPEASDAFRPISQSAIAPAERHAQARWEQVAAFNGTGTANESFAVQRGAVQWTAAWRCSSGSVRMVAAGGARKPEIVANAGCPGTGSKTASGDGPVTLQVRATGAWRAVVRQQVDTALQEPPLAGMTKGAELARGRVHPIQKKGEGTVALYRLPSGRLALRFDGFYTTPSPGLELWLSQAKNPNSTLDARASRHVNAGTIRSTFGSYNQMLPADIRAEDVRSIVVWCPTVTIAFSAAALKAPR